MSLAAQLWGSTNERIHTIGTLSLGLSAIFFLSLEPAIKQEGLLIFTTFGLGAALIGVATLRYCSHGHGGGGGGSLGPAPP